MIIVITGMFPVYDKNGIGTGKKEFIASHGIDYDTGQTVILPCEHPAKLGAEYDDKIGEWILL